MSDKKFQRKMEKIKKQGERYKQEAELREAYDKYVPERKKRKTSNVMLVISVIAIVAYVVANYILQVRLGIELSPTITPYWFAFWTSEIFLLAGIKVGKVIKGSSDDNICG